MPGEARGAASHESAREALPGRGWPAGAPVRLPAAQVSHCTDPPALGHGEPLRDAHPDVPSLCLPAPERGQRLGESPRGWSGPLSTGEAWDSPNSRTAGPGSPACPVPPSGRTARLGPPHLHSAPTVRGTPAVTLSPMLGDCLGTKSTQFVPGPKSLVTVCQPRAFPRARRRPFGPRPFPAPCWEVAPGESAGS